MGVTSKLAITYIFQSMLILLSNTATVPTKPPITQECYTAAVYEHVKYYGTIEEDPQSVMNVNLAAYENATRVAHEQGADIIVFPEYGLFGIVPDNRPSIRPYLDNVPSGDERKNPCNEPQDYLNNSFLVTLSCMAKRHNIYLVANVGDIKACTKETDPECPEDGAYQYNTNVVFDRAGTVISRYHKYHLYYEFKYNVPKEYEYVYFDTEFGRLASFVCFDIIFKPGVTLIEDYGIDTMVFSTWWFDGPPTLIANQIQEGFAVRNKVNFLASNNHVPKYASLGSGIYAGINGAVAFTHIPDGNSKLVIARIPSQSAPGKTCSDKNISKVINFEEHEGPRIPVPEYSALSPGIDKCAFVKLLRSEDQMEACNDGLCCRLKYKLTDASGFGEGEEFYFSVCNVSDTDLHGRYNWTAEKCFLAKINPQARRPEPQTAWNTTTIFQEVQIEGVFSTKYIYPSVTGNDRQLVDRRKWNFDLDEESRHSTISIVDSGEPLLIVSLYGRAFDRDPPYRQ